MWSGRVRDDATESSILEFYSGASDSSNAVALTD